MNPDPERVRRLVGRVQGLPTLPAILQRLNSMIVDPHTTAKQVGQLISSDPAVTARILKVVNSAFYGFPSRITTVTHAIVILGFNTVKSIVLSSSIFDTFRGQSESPYRREDFWKHSIGTGAACRVIGKAIGYTALEDFFIAGLLHDVGKIVLDQYLHDDFVRVLEVVEKKDCLFVEAEAEVLGVTHAEVAGWLFEQWKLSKGLVQAVACHHNPALSDEVQKITSVIHLGDIVCRALQIGSGGDRKIPACSPTAWEALGLTEGRIPEILRATEEEAERAMVFLDFL
ncbi:MAG: HDOD domain-containing protein [Planctomycetes bacterium]|nr:HDOD domain-containing protein [Planctomycetota bacterium]